MYHAMGTGRIQQNIDILFWVVVSKWGPAFKGIAFLIDGVGL
jgi:hypothetical protein